VLERLSLQPVTDRDELPPVGADALGLSRAFSWVNQSRFSWLGDLHPMNLSSATAPCSPDRRRPILSGLGTAVILVGATVGLLGCGGSSSSTTSAVASRPVQTTRSSHSAPAPTGPTYPVVLPEARRQEIMSWTPAVTLRGRTTVWLSRVPGEGEPITMLRFDQPPLRLALHSGSVDPGGSGWRYGASIGALERQHVVAGFEGGFMLSDGVGGFFSQGRHPVALTPGLASIVTYASGESDIGSWRGEVPASDKMVFSVRQNLHLLIDHGRPAANIQTCVIACWGPTLGGGLTQARGALGIDSAGRLIYAGGERLSVGALADALVNAGVQRAAELDINPEWVNLYLYAHGAGGSVRAVPMIPGQPGIPGQLLTAYGRDFFTVVAP